MLVRQTRRRLRGDYVGGKAASSRRTPKRREAKAKAGPSPTSATRAVAAGFGMTGEGRTNGAAAREYGGPMKKIGPYETTHSKRGKQT